MTAYDTHLYRRRVRASLLAALCLLTLIPAARALPAAAMPGTYDPAAYGAKEDGKTDDTAAVQRALAAAHAAHGTFLLTKPCAVRAPLVADGCDVLFLAPGRLDAGGLPAGAAALTVRNTDNDNLRPRIEGVYIRGPGALVLGQRTAHCDGLRVECQASAVGCRVQGFDAGLVIASPQGHVRFRDCTSTRNYYNAYFAVAGGDYTTDGCYLDGAAMASIGVSGSVGVEGLTARDTHAGFSPYAILQEAPAAGQPAAAFFLQDCAFDHFRQEQIGNGAMVSLVPGTPGGARCETKDTTIIDPGFGWGDAYRLASLPRDYALVGDLLSGRVVIEGGAHPYTAGDKGIYNFTQYAASIAGYGASISLDGRTVTTLAATAAPSGAAN